MNISFKVALGVTALLVGGCANGQLELSKSDCINLIAALGTGACERLGKDITLTPPAAAPTVIPAPTLP